MPASPVVARLRALGSPETIAGMARYNIPSARAFGVSVGQLKKLAKSLGRDHALAAELWASGWYEARMLASYVDEPARVDRAQMQRWAEDFDSWSICDTVCFHLFDRAPPAWEVIPAWAGAEALYVKRAACAQLWALSVHDKKAPDARFEACLPLLEAAADDPRDHVKKAVDMALRAVGKRNRALHAAVLELAQSLCGKSAKSALWIGRKVQKELTSAKVRERLEKTG